MTDLSNEEFRRLYEAHRDDLYRYLVKLSGSPDVADDLTQDVFVRIREKYHLFDAEKGAFMAWACTIARNTYLNQVKRESRVDQSFDEKLEHSLSGSGDPAREVEQNLLSGKIRDIIAALPEPERTVFYLMKVKLLSREQIGQRLGMSTRSVSRKLVNAIELLRRELEREQILVT